MSKKIKIMLSSRCNTEFPAGSGTTLSDIRRELKEEIEGAELFGKPVFEVWINEETPAQSALHDSWETCMEAVKDCDIFISLYSGHAGWAEEAGEVGICHAELMTANSTAPTKVRLISLGNIDAARDDEEEQRNQRFAEYIEKQSLFHAGKIENADELKRKVQEAILDAVINLTHTGVLYASQGKFHSGKPLEWSRLNYKQRHDAMCSVLTRAMSERAGSKAAGKNVTMSIAGEKVLMIPHAIPDAISIGQAKEMVGQPFLRDHEYAALLSAEQGGPVHIIACHKGATETQAKKLLGFPDAIVVDTPFGIYVADNIQKIQFVFIRECRDETTTRSGLQRYFNWLTQNGEDLLLAKRALARARIVRAMVKEL